MMGLIGALYRVIKWVIAIHGIPPYPWQLGSKEMYVAVHEIILKAVSK
jgi:hypothetical protein